MSRPAPDLVPSPKDRSRSARDHGTQTDKRVFYTSRDLGRKVSGHPDSFAFRSSGAWRERLRPNLLVDMVSGTPKPTTELPARDVVLVFEGGPNDGIVITDIRGVIPSFSRYKTSHKDVDGHVVLVWVED